MGSDNTSGDNWGFNSLERTLLDSYQPLGHPVRGKSVCVIGDFSNPPRDLGDILPPIIKCITDVSPSLSLDYELVVLLGSSEDMEHFVIKKYFFVPSKGSGCTLLIQIVTHRKERHLRFKKVSNCNGLLVYGFRGGSPYQ